MPNVARKKFIKDEILRTVPSMARITFSQAGESDNCRIIIGDGVGQVFAKRDILQLCTKLLLLCEQFPPDEPQEDF